jgi:hypothetical protein
MKIYNFIKTWAEVYYAEKQLGLKKARITSYFIIPLCILQIWNLKSIVEYSEKWLEYEFIDGAVRALIFQLTIVLGLSIRFLALRFNGRYAQRFSDAGILIAFSAWLAHFVWTMQWLNEAKKIVDICTPPILLYTIAPLGLFLTIGFSGWLLYKTIFLIAVTWKTVRK